MPDDEKTGFSYWFALAVRPRVEEAVSKTLRAKGYDTFLPLYRKQCLSGTRSWDSELPLFPGYVCCRFDIRNRLPILTTPGVVQVLGDGNTPVALSEVEVASLQAAVRANYPVQPFPYVRTGKRVRIEEGLLAGTEGIVLSFKPALRLILSITLLQKSALLEVERGQISESGLSCVAFSGD
jgi:transcription termination/antitermination protein NusG